MLFKEFGSVPDSLFLICSIIPYGSTPGYVDLLFRFAFGYKDEE